MFLQLLDVDPQDQAEEEGANVDLDSQRKGKCAVIKTSTRQVIWVLVNVIEMGRVLGFRQMFNYWYCLGKVCRRVGQLSGNQPFTL